MKIQIDVGGTSLLLTPVQAEYIFNILQDCEVIEQRWVGSGKGFFGRDLDQEIAFKSFDAAHHSQGVKVWPEAMVDKYKSLIEYRKQEEN